MATQILNNDNNDYSNGNGNGNGNGNDEEVSEFISITWCWQCNENS